MNREDDSRPTAGDGPPSHSSVLRDMSTPSQMIGPYRLLSLLGEGGFGEVWLAERRESIVQRVALKIIKPGMDSRGVIARFEQERQALAVMDHPNVARVFDAGTTPNGRPYFVMEYVSGEAITGYCDRNRLTLNQRLGLFCQVCEAVQHAHLKGIIHRDLKPGNILIETIDQHAVPKVIDFGVAKAISGSFTEMTVYTEIGQVIGTPEYMSPEQAELGGRDVDTRSDVYSLGAVLYELLTGVLPFDSKALRDKGYDEIRRIIREVEPPRPSTRLLTWTGRRASPETTALATEIAKRRRVEPPELVHALRRELEWIPLKAMRKDRSERYLTPVAMADDIRRYLAGEPLLAGPDKASYKARKFLRRNRAAVLAGTAILSMLVLGLAGTAWGWRRATREREAAIRAEAESKHAQAEAVRRQAQAESTLKFLTGVLEDANAVQNRGRTFTVREMLEIAGNRVDREFKENTEGRLAVQSVVGNALSALGLDEEALPHLEDALQIARSVNGPRSEAAADLMFNVATNLISIKSDSASTTRAESLLKEAIAIRKNLYGESDPRTARLIGILSQFYSIQGDATNQEQFYLESLRLMPNNWGKSIDDLRKEITAVVARANSLGADGKWDEAQRTFLDYSKPYFAIPGMRHNFPDSTAMLAGEFARRGYRFAARAAVLLALRIAEEEYQDLDEAKSNTLGLAGESLVQAGFNEEGAALVLQWLDRGRRSVLRNSPSMPGMIARAGAILGRAGRAEEAEKLYLEAIELAKTHDTAVQVIVGNRYAVTLRNLGRIDEAARIGSETYQKARSGLGVSSKQAKNLAKWLADLYKAKDDSANAELWSKRAQGED